MRPTLLVAAAALIASCGGSSSSSPVVPTDAGGSGSGGSGADAGGAGGGGTGTGNSQVHVAVQFTGKGSGRVTSSPAGIECPGSCAMTITSGTTVTLSAQPDDSSMFLGWGGACGGPACSFVASGDSVAYPNFDAKTPPQQTWALRVTSNGSGTVRSTPAAIECGQTCSASFADGTRVALSATPGAGWKFSGWSGACSGTSDCVLTMSADAAVQATFAQVSPPPADECAALTPAALTPAVVASLPDSGCLGGTSDDGTGNYVLSYLAGPGPTFPEYLFFTIKDGQAQRIGDPILGSDEGGLSVFSQPSGFSSFHVSGFSGGSLLASYSHEGALVSRQDVATAHFPFNESPASGVSVDPSGGTALVRTQFENGLWVSSYRRLDKTGSPETDWVWLTSASAQTTVRAAGVALSGNVLVMVGDGSSTWNARWLTRTGKPITDWFDVPAQAGARTLQFLMDGSLAFRSRSARYPFAPGPWLGRFEDGKASMSPAPQWMQERNGGAVFVIRNGRAYASWGAAGGSCAGSDLEVVAVSGKSCGCLSVPNLNDVSSVGRDGSLIAARPEPSVNKCQYDLYPQLLR